jgi:hypothetical protein
MIVMIKRTKSFYNTNETEYLISDVIVKLLGITIWKSKYKFEYEDLTEEETIIGYNKK